MTLEVEQSTSATTEQADNNGFAAQLAREIRDGGPLDLPGFPEAVLRIQRKIDSPNSSAEDVVKVLRTEPALAARALQIANSVAFQGSQEITDLQTAVSRLGFSLVRSIAISFAIQQLRMRGTYSDAARAEIEATWHASLRVASTCYLIAKYCTRINRDQALLAGLLHVLGRLYVVMRAEGGQGATEPALLEAAKAHEPAIGKLILATWGLSETFQNAVLHQDDLAYQASEISVTEILIAGKFLAEQPDADPTTCPVIEHLAAVRGENPVDVLRDNAEELSALRASLGG